MQNPIIERLFKSFEELEQALASAKATIEKKGDKPELLERLNSYDEMIKKQRSLAEEAAKFIDEGNLEELNRRVNLINGLSAMIRDDAREILQQQIGGNFK